MELKLFQGLLLIDEIKKITLRSYRWIFNEAAMKVDALLWKAHVHFKFIIQISILVSL